MSILRRILFSQTRLVPSHVINGFFAIVFVFVTILFWYQGNILRQVYEANRMSQLESVTSQLQSRMQYRIDTLRFLRNYMSFILQVPPSPRQQATLLQELERIQAQDTWQIAPQDSPGAPIFGVNPQLMAGGTSLFKVADRQQQLRELNATLRLRSLLPLIDVSPHRYQPKIYYVSRAGFYLSDPPLGPPDQVEKIYRRIISQPYFTQATKSADPERMPFWTHIYDDISDGPVLTASLPIDYDNQWIGALCIDFTVERLRQYLSESVPPENKSIFLLFDNRYLAIASSDPNWYLGKYFSPEQREELRLAIGDKQHGTLRLGTRFITFEVLDNVNATLINIQELHQGMHGEYGRVTLLLTALWALFAALLLVSRRVILRLIDNMEGLQRKLSWRASHDAMTRMLNRVALFQQGAKMSQHEQLTRLPMSVIQMDLDHFKRINDRYGHQTGDLALIHAADIIRQSIRVQDLAGRVGGEEFCMLLPDTSLQQASTIAERIRTNLAASELQLEDGKKVRITASLGVACSAEINCTKTEQLQLLADKRLYRAKANGRNQVVSSGELG